MAGVWGYAQLDGFLERPSAYAPGTAMTFAGLRDEGQRMDLIAYLRSLSETPMALPDPLPAAMDVVDTAETEAAAATDMPATQDATEPMETPAEDAAPAEHAGDGH